MKPGARCSLLVDLRGGNTRALFHLTVPHDAAVGDLLVLTCVEDTDAGFTIGAAQPAAVAGQLFDLLSSSGAASSSSQHPPPPPPAPSPPAEPEFEWVSPWEVEVTDGPLLLTNGDAQPSSSTLSLIHI